MPSLCDLAPHVTNLWQINTIFIRFVWQFFSFTFWLRLVHYIWWFKSMVGWGRTVTNVKFLIGQPRQIQRPLYQWWRQCRPACGLPQCGPWEQGGGSQGPWSCTLNAILSVHRNYFPFQPINGNYLGKNAPIRLAASIRDKVDAKLALRRLNCCVSRSSGHLEDAMQAFNIVEISILFCMAWYRSRHKTVRLYVIN